MFKQKTYFQSHQNAAILLTAYFLQNEEPRSGEQEVTHKFIMLNIVHLVLKRSRTEVPRYNEIRLIVQ